MPLASICSNEWEQKKNKQTNKQEQTKAETKTQVKKLRLTSYLPGPAHQIYDFYDYTYDINKVNCLV